MTTKHLTDDEVQQYILDGATAGKEIAAHVHSCEECRARAETYRLLITGIEQQPAGAFDFDLEKLVLSQIPAPHTKKKSDNLLAWVFILPALLIGGLVIYLFWDYLPGFFAGITTLAAYLVAVSAIIILAILSIDMYKMYKKKMNSLDLY